MADTKTTALTQLTAAAAADFVPIVDDSDTGMAASGTTKYINPDDFFGASTAIPYNLNMDGSSGNGLQFNGGDVFDTFVQKTTWTPTVIGVTSGVGTYVTQVGRYSRIGDVVVAVFRVDFTKNTITGEVRIGGLPVTSSSLVMRAGCAIGEATQISFTDQMTIESVPNTTQMRLLSLTQGGAAAAIDDTDLHASNTMIITGTLVYLA